MKLNIFRTMLLHKKNVLGGLWRACSRGTLVRKMRH